MKHYLILLTVLLESLLVSRVWAQGSSAEAVKLYEQADREMNARNFKDACPRLEEVVRLEPTAVGAHVRLAACYEGLGRTASAWSQWTRAEAVAQRENKPDRAAEARSHIAALEPRLAYVTTTVSPELKKLPGLTIERDGVAIGKAQWDNAMPVDAGGHELTVTATGYNKARMRFVVPADGARVQVTAPSISPDSTTSWQYPVGITGMVAGGVGLALAGVFGGLALQANEESNAGPCTLATNRCTDEGLELREDAITFGDTSTALFVVGGVLAGTGIIIFLTSPGLFDAATEGPRAAMRIGPSGGTLVLAF